MSAVGEETSELKTSYCLRRKLYCYFAPSHLTPENFVSHSAFCLSFVFFVFIFCPIETNTSNLQSLTQSDPAKNTNQVTLSNEHINYFF